MFTCGRKEAALSSSLQQFLGHRRHRPTGLSAAAGRRPNPPTVLIRSDWPLIANVMLLRSVPVSTRDFLGTRPPGILLAFGSWLSLPMMSPRTSASPRVRSGKLDKSARATKQL
jgi:hypothetical protein